MEVKVAVGLFSGGKESLYAMHVAEKQGFNVKYLISFFTSLPVASPHAENIGALRLIAQSMKKELITIDLSKGEQNLINLLKTLNADVLIGGDIYGDAHPSWLKDICDRAGLGLLEPLFGMEPLKLFHEIFNSGFKATVVGIDPKYLREELLGFIISAETANMFFSKIGSIDPLGENGEYHTIVIESPLYASQFKIRSVNKIVEKNIVYLKISLE